MTENPYVNPKEGTFLMKVVPPRPWPPQTKINLGEPVNLFEVIVFEIQATPNATFIFHLKTNAGIHHSLESCPVSFVGDGIFPVGVGYDTLSLRISAGGFWIAANTDEVNVVEKAEIQLKPIEVSELNSLGKEAENWPAIEPRRFALFDAAKMKIARAESHIYHFEYVSKAFLEAKPYVVVKELHPDGVHYRRVVRAREHIPVEIALIVGDAVHNLRAALDLLATDLVRANGESPDNVYFPFCKNEEDIDKMIKRRNLHLAPPDVVEMIKALRPYKGGNHMLRALHDLDIVDKHKLIIPVAGLVFLPNLEIDFNKGLALGRLPEQTVHPVEDGTVIEDFIPADMIVDDQATDFQITFDDEQPLAHLEILKCLKELLELVDGIVQTFSDHVSNNGTS